MFLFVHRIFLFLKFCYWLFVLCLFFVFFFQAEDGIRDRDVTGVQTCALPICFVQGYLHDLANEQKDLPKPVPTSNPMEKAFNKRDRKSVV